MEDKEFEKILSAEELSKLSEEEVKEHVKNHYEKLTARSAMHGIKCPAWEEFEKAVEEKNFFKVLGLIFEIYQSASRWAAEHGKTIKPFAEMLKEFNERMEKSTKGGD